MGRSPCCDKVGLKKGPWTPEEDQKLLAYIEENGHGSWRALPSKAGLQRCGKSCRLRWTNYLRPDIKRGKFSLQEEQTIIQLHALLGNRWSAIATHLPKRTDNEIKNYWNTHLKKRLTKMGIDPVSHKPKNDTLLSTDGDQSKSVANLSHMAQWESARLEAEARLVKQSKLRCTTTVAIAKHLLEPPSTSAGPPTKCLDILKAWNQVWGNKHSMNDHVESPTSTLSTTGAGAGAGAGESSTNNFLEFVSSGSCEDGTTGEECEEEWEYKQDQNQMDHNSVPFNVDNTWTTESSKSDNNGSSNFLESFTDLLLSSSGGGNRSCDNLNTHLEEPNNSVSEADNNKNYWNNILDLVNSSLQDPPLF